MTFVSCSIPEQFVNPLFEVFDGGDFILSSYRDIEEDFTRMRIYFEDSAQAEAAKKALADAMSIVGVDAPIEVGDIPDEDWKFAYRRHFKTEEIGKRLVVVPEWEVEDFRRKAGDAKRKMIVLDPGMAFGTGKHETTHACLEYIDELAGQAGQKGIGEHGTGNRSFLDMGCGSGILSIAAAKLGFAPVKGFDVDQEAVDASIENAAKNGVTVDFVKFALGRKTGASASGRMSGRPDASTANHENAQVRYDLVAANILGPLLIRFADEIVPSVGKDLIISGILTELYPEVLAAYEARGLREVSRRTIGEWTTGLLTKRA